MTILVGDLVPDELWAMVEPLLPVPPRPPYGGRHRAIPDRNCFAAIVYMAAPRLPGGCCRSRNSAVAVVAFVLVACALVCFNRL